MTPQNRKMPSPPSSDGSSNSTLAMLSGLNRTNLQTETAEAVEHLQTGQKTAAAELDAKILEMQEQIEQASKIQNPIERDERLRVLTATLESIRQEDIPEREDFAKAVLGLNALMGAMGGDFESLMKPSGEEEALINGAKAVLQLAEASLAAASTKINWFGINRRGKATAAAKQDIEAAKARLQEAEQRAKEMRRQRLMSASIEGSMQEFSLMVDKTLTLMRERHRTTNDQLRTVTSRKKEAFNIKQQAAETLATLDEQLNAAEADLLAAEDVLGTLGNGTKEYVEQEEKVSNLKAHAEEIRGNRNTANAIFLSKERYASELEIHQQSIQRTYDTQKVWIAQMTSDSEERQVTFRSRVAQMQALADLDVVANQDKVGKKIDAANAGFMAASGAAAGRALQDMLEDHPDQIALLERIRAAQAESTAQLRVREAEMIEQFKRRWGINPLAGSYLHGQGGESQAPTPAGAPA